ncbi:MAG: putative molybdenum carrier protein [Pseudomonadota bacterium]
MSILVRIISGGQTGADQGALAAARELGLPTGGAMPLGFMTEAGPRPEFASLYGMRELIEPDPLARTEINVRESDGTLILGDAGLGGSRATKEFCDALGKPAYPLPWHPGELAPLSALPDIRRWLADTAIRTLNVAGNRESEAPGIFAVTREVLLAALKAQDAHRSIPRS